RLSSTGLRHGLPNGNRNTCARILARQQDLKNSNRAIDVLDLLLAEIFVFHFEPVTDLITHCPGDADSARLSYGFEPDRHIDAITEDVVAFHDHIAKIDADAIKQGARSRHVTIAPRHALLKIYCAPERLGDALEFD